MKPRQIYEMLPARLRVRAKAVLGGAGHGRSWLDGLKARDSAMGKKRLDRSAQDMAQRFSASGITEVAGKSCMEFGAGYVPSEALIFHLMGASRVVATDYNALGQFDQLFAAAIACDRAKFLGAVEKFGDAKKAEERLDTLCRLGKRRGVSYLKQVIEYVAPHDMSQTPIKGTFDIINSVSVLEHIPPSAAISILQNLRTSLSSVGVMAHVIDMRDHLDLEGNPLGFLARDTDYVPDRDFDVRGNRLRKGDWMKLFCCLPDTNTTCSWEQALDASKIPPVLLPDFVGLSCDEARVGIVLMLSRSCETT